MFRLMMLLAGLRGLLTSRPGFQNSFLQIIFPEKIQANTSDNSKVENEQVSYIIPIDEKPYTVHLRQRFFLADNFMVYLYNQGSVNSHSSNIQPESAVPDLIPLYLEMHIVVDKVLYDYLGSDSMMVTNKVIEIIGLVNSMFTPFKITIVLSSLELWSDKNKISTVGEADELLHAFLDWKKSYLTLRPHDIAYLFIYREYPDYVGAAFPGKMCVTSYSAGIALYPKGITLEAFSIIVTQMLGLSLGISYDDPRKCRCSGAICIMSPKAMQSSGVKTFSNCSLSDFENFISNMGARCLQNKPQMQRAPASICGNGRVEGNEICDCGTEEQCGPDSCCNPRTCVLKPNTQCDRGSCCNNCQLMQAGAVCRPIAHPECDVPEVCNGSSGSCPADITIHNGHKCKGGKAFCFDGGCQDLDARCESIYGKGSKNAPFACYEEIQSQTDRFGNCGRERSKYKFCAWRNLICGRLICTYPFQTPFLRDGASVIYAFVRNTVCITMHYTTKGGEDPMVVKNGSICDTGRICVNRECVESRILADRSYECSLKCNGHGVCTSEMTCNCSSGYRPPDCRALSRIPSRLPGGQGLIKERGFEKAGEKQWLLGTYIALPVLVVATIVAVSWKPLKKWFSKKEEPQSSESEGSTHRNASRSTSESSSQTDTVR
ncbi:disintegrin and metalloproteinase domain-containing protein 32 isoform X6 [Orcinus orca]|uniref:disintegrin and metalloproteinase domain-containing protein 32 isoform X6 n=1 Tax=Orcinus orca TaxID=9733 RepID=UPI0021113E2E|nr:disintegrin and metalloproteinase domain-containing protein 32 isoform X6 [Orcinus orca]